MTLRVQYQTTRDSAVSVTEHWIINGQGWIVRPGGTYFVLPQYVRGIIDVLITGKIISCLPLIDKNKLYRIKAIASL